MKVESVRPYPGTPQNPVTGPLAGDSFEQALRQTLQPQKALRFSAHARERMQTHGIELNQEEMSRLESAVSQARSKGIRDTLVVSPSVNFIVSVQNSAVITVVPRGAPQGDVFSQIDGAVVM